MRDFSVWQINSGAQRNLIVRKFLFAGVLALIALTIVGAVFQNRKWVVPEEAKKRVSPLSSTAANLRAGKVLYAEKCAECHGDTGKGDGPQARTHRPLPADLTDATRMNSVLDGEIFYQISEGKRPMPAFKKRLAEEQRWQLVLLVRSFSAPAMMPDISSTPLSGRQ